MKAKDRPRLRLTDRQCEIFRKDMIEFGYKVSKADVRRIADQVSEGTYKQDDPVAIIMRKQIDEATEARRSK
jgi:precorrin-4 methylase